MLVIQTRWHADDLAGWLLEMGKANPDADQWEVLSFPAIRGKADSPYDPRQPGEALWPERFSAESLETTRVTIGAYDWSAMYDQSPTVAGGSVFQRDHFRYFRVLDREVETGPVGGRRTVLEPFVVLDCDGKHDVPATEFPLKDAVFFQVCDTAKKLTETAKYTAVLTFASLTCRDASGGVLKRVLLVWDAWREKLLINEQYKILLELQVGRGEFDPRTRTWRTPPAARRWPKPIAFQFVEDAASGEGLLQQAAADGANMSPAAASGSKIARASAASVLYERGLVYHLESMRGLGDLETELQDFPTGTYLDQADCVGHAALKFNAHRFLSKAVDGFFVHPNEAEVAAKELEGTTWINGQQVEFPEDDRDKLFG